LRVPFRHAIRNTQYGKRMTLIPPSISILGVRIHAITMAEALTWIEAAVGARSPRQICTGNPEFLMTARRDPEFLEVLNRADLVVPDGVGLLMAARWLGGRLPERVAGSDLIYRIAERAAQRGWGLYFLGAAEGVASRTAETLTAMHPGLKVVGTFVGSPKAEEEEVIVARVRAAQPDILLVAYGAPQQDKWIARNRERLGVPVSIGVGGAFDFVVGETRRAPVWIQRLGLEWLHRVGRQPWRARRILTAVVLFPLAILRHGRGD
jgi:N-acetylglucosaminyldiphosphoundecaprenol N-acetyl-beta-D-mannosaminyltransferase